MGFRRSKRSRNFLPLPSRWFKTSQNVTDLSSNKRYYTDYLTGFQYGYDEWLFGGTSSVVLSFFPHKEGYVNNRAVYTNPWDRTPSSYVFEYVYNHTDHLGNVRLSYRKNGTSTQIIEENNYYPFGMKHKGYNDNSFGGSYKYKYQGQERQDKLGLNWDSFKWRNYDFAIGRFMSIDPLSEKYVYNSTYAFQENKMGLGRELEGLELLGRNAGWFIMSESQNVLGQSQTHIGVKQTHPMLVNNNGEPTFSAASVGLFNDGYDPNRNVMYQAPPPMNTFTFENPFSGTPSMADTTGELPMGLGGTPNKTANNLNTGLGGVAEIMKYVKAIFSIGDMMDAHKFMVAKDELRNQTELFGEAISMVDQTSLFNTNGVSRNDLINFVYDGTLNSAQNQTYNNNLIKNGVTVLQNYNQRVLTDFQPQLPQQQINLQQQLDKIKLPNFTNTLN